MAQGIVTHRHLAILFEQSLRLMLAWLWLAAWKLWAPRMGCISTVLLMTPAVMVLAWNMLEPALLRRQAFVAQYLRQERWLGRLLSRRLLLSLWHILKAMVLAVALMMTAIQWPDWMPGLLAADLVVALLLYRFLVRFLARQARPAIAGTLARQGLVWLNFLLLVPAVAVCQLLTSHPDYREMGWNATVAHALLQVQTGCDLLTPLARAGAAQEAIAWRLMQLGLDRISNQYLALGAWLLFFLTTTLALWGWSRLLAGALTGRRGLHLLAGSSDHA